MGSERDCKSLPRTAIAVRAIVLAAVVAFSVVETRAQLAGPRLAPGANGLPPVVKSQVRPLPPVEYPATVFGSPDVDFTPAPCVVPESDCFDFGCTRPAERDCWSCLAAGLDLGVVARGYYFNDQRIEWSGMEATCGAEGVFNPVFRNRSGDWETTVEGEFYFNQPFEDNVLIDTPERASYLGNYEVDIFQISKLSITCRRGDFAVTAGKIMTPFGRTHFPLFTNAWVDAPFIRTESILWRETGLLLRYDPGCLEVDVAMTNGGPAGDANSSKALVSRAGLRGENWCAGISIKLQDGIGSEDQKMFNNHVGADFMVRRGPFTLSGEVIADEYGFRRPTFDPNDITWRRSIYYREQNYRLHEPITGLGYYLNLGFEHDCWGVCLNYGEFRPQQLGDPRHDITNRRGIVKVAYSLSDRLQLYTVIMSETAGYIAQTNRPRKGGVLITGLQWTL